MPKQPNLHKFVKGLNPRMFTRTTKLNLLLHKFVVQAQFYAHF